MNSGVKPQKQTVFIAKSTKIQFLLTNCGDITSSLGVSGLELHSSSTKPVNFFGAQSSLEGAQFSFGGKSSDLGGTAPECPPWRRAWFNLKVLPPNPHRKAGNEERRKKKLTFLSDPLYRYIL